MAYSDIQRLRQQQIFAPMDMGQNYGLTMGGEDAPMPMMAPSPVMDYYNPVQQIQQPSPQPQPQMPQPRQTQPTFPTGGIAPSTSPVEPPQSQIDPTKTPAGASPLSQGDTLQQLIDATNKIYTPSTVDRDRNRALLDAAPERQPPSFARALVAGGLSLKAQDPIKASEDVMYAPHRRNMTDWVAKTGPFSQASQQENTANINERTLAGNIANAAVQLDKTAQNTKIAEERNRIAEIRALAQKAKANGYAVKILGDRVVGINPEGKRIELGSSGGMNERDKIDLEGEWDVKAAEARGSAAVRTAEAGATASGRGLVVIDGVTYEPDPDIGGYRPVQGLPRGGITRPGTPLRPGTATTPKTSSLETRRVIQDELKERYQVDSDSRKFIKKESGLFDFQPRPVVGEKVRGSTTFGFGGTTYTEADVAEYDAFRKEVDPSYTPPVSKGLAPRGGESTETKPNTGIGPKNPPVAGRGTAAASPQQKTVSKKEYSPSRNQTRITYSDGTTSIVSGKQ